MVADGGSPTGPHCVLHAGGTYLCADVTSQRLTTEYVHRLDVWSGGALRRVGISWTSSNSPPPPVRES